MVVALLGQAMRRACLADVACKGKLVGRDLVALQSRLWGRGRRGRGSAGLEAGRGGQVRS